MIGGKLWTRPVSYTHLDVYKRQGIGVLRYEKRTREHAAEFAQDTTEARKITVKEETIDDAVLAVKLLKTIDGIDPDRIFVIGHSLGATVGPRIAQACGSAPSAATGQGPAEGLGSQGSGSPYSSSSLPATGSGSPASDSDAATSIAGLVMMAATSRNLVDLIPEQIQYLANLDGTVDEKESKQIQEVRAAVEKIKSGRMAEGEMVLGAPQLYWDDLAAHNQVEIAKQLTLPILILQGERDYQVTMVDLNGWKTALSGKSNVSIKTYPDLNHLFMSGSGKSTPDEYAVPSNVSEEVVNDIEMCIRDRIKVGCGVNAKGGSLMRLWSSRVPVASTMLLVLLATMFFGLVLQGCAPKQPAEPLKTQEELEGMAKEFINALGEGKYDDARKEFDKKMAAAAPAAKLNELWTGIVSQAGKWHKISGTRFAEEAGYRVVYVTGLFEKGSLDIKVVFDKQGKISGMWLGTLESNEYKTPGYANQELFTEEEVVVGEGKWALPGTLSIDVYKRQS